MTGFYDLQDEYRRQAQAGQLTEALETARQLWDAFPDRRNFTWMFLAAAYAAMGDLHAVAQALRQALDGNFLWRLSLFEIPELELVRSDPGCQAVIEEARKRIKAKNYRPLVDVERPLRAGIAPLLLHLHGANSDAASELPHWRAAATRLDRRCRPVVATKRRGPLLLGSAARAAAAGLANDYKYASSPRAHGHVGFLAGRLGRASGGAAQ